MVCLLQLLSCPSNIEDYARNGKRTGKQRLGTERLDSGLTEGPVYSLHLVYKLLLVGKDSYRCEVKLYTSVK